MSHFVHIKGVLCSTSSAIGCHGDKQLVGSCLRQLLEHLWPHYPAILYSIVLK